ncbi:hypothetical protein [Halomicrococcus sp. NG-SE-24]|uniref:hypothetical protein n=1 Tax=Halomicrococcus sp. NG-SE-24 TaxID=3436928 RepID=UPI003D95BAAB
MSNSSVGDLWSGVGLPRPAPTRLQLLALLVGGKLIDAVSTVVVLGLRDDVFESVWLTRTLMAKFGSVGGSLITVVVAVVGVALLAESGLLIRRVTPDDWTPDGYPAAFRTTTYLAASVWYAYLGVNNFSLLL